MPCGKLLPKKERGHSFWNILKRKEGHSFWNEGSIFFYGRLLFPFPYPAELEEKIDHQPLLKAPLQFTKRSQNSLSFSIKWNLPEVRYKLRNDFGL